jgi:ligand-binding SRPBCC domain-containing protein
MAPTPVAPTLTFVSRLEAPADRVWSHATSMIGVNRELAPYLRMTYPPGMETLSEDKGRLGEPVFTSIILAFGALPVDRWELILVEVGPGRRFVEQSRVLSMKLWRHERTVEERGAGCMITDALTFAPRLPFTRAPLTTLVRALFGHRHRFLKRAFG